MEALKLYDYQEECIGILDTEKKGIVCLPTGTGKTLIQATIISNDIIKHPNEFRLYVINAPRIMLSYQLMTEVYTHMMNSRIDSMYMCVHSGTGADKDDLQKIRTETNKINKSIFIGHSDIDSGTSPDAIRKRIQKAKRKNLPLVIFSTYNSAERIEDARISKVSEETYEQVIFNKPIPEDFDFTSKYGEDDYYDALRKWNIIDYYNKKPIEPFTELVYKKINIVMNDEAHYLIQERFYPILKILKSDRCYFFTATVVVSKFDKKDSTYDGRGMNNVESYGKILYSMSPLEAIQRGKMVRPRLHFLVSEKGKYSVEDFDKSIGSIIFEAFKHHTNAIDGMKPKILVSVRGVGDIINFLNCKDELEKIILRGTNVYAVASDKQVGNKIIYSKNNHVEIENVDRQQFLRRLKEDGKNREKSLIVLHFDILAEGIDVSGFSGILPMRALEKPKFLQTFGRAARLDINDRERLDSGGDSGDLSKFIKPYAWVIIPAIIHENEDNKNQIESIILELRNEYGLKPYEDIIVSEDKNGIPVVVGLEGQNFSENTRNVKSIIEEVEHIYEDKIIADLREIEDNRLDDLSDEEFLNEVINIEVDQENLTDVDDFINQVINNIKS